MSRSTDIEEQLVEAFKDKAARVAVSPLELGGARVRQRLTIRRKYRRARLIAIAVTAAVGLVVAIGAGREIGRERERVTVGPPPVPVLPAVPRVAVFGGSEALQAGLGLGEGYRASGNAALVEGFTGLGCTVIRTEQRRTPGAGVEDSDATCNDWERIWQEKVDVDRPDVAVIYPGAWEIADRRLPGDNAWRGPGDPVFDAFMASEFQAAIDVLGSRGATVVWVVGPHPGPNAGTQLPAARTARVNEIARQVVAQNANAAVVEFGAWMDALAEFEQARLRPDGVHLANAPGNDTTKEVCERFLCAAILDAARSTTSARDSEPWPSTGRGSDPDRCLVSDRCVPADALAVELGYQPAGYTLLTVDARGLMAGARQRTWLYQAQNGTLVVDLFTAALDDSTFEAAGAQPSDGTPITIGERPARASTEPIGEPETEVGISRIGAALAPGVQLVVSSASLSLDELVRVFGEITVLSRIDPMPQPGNDVTTRGLVTMASIDQDIVTTRTMLESSGWVVLVTPSDADRLPRTGEGQVALDHAADGRVQAVRFAPD